MSPDGIVASRLRTDGRYEHAVLDEYGMPIEWRTAIRPDLNLPMVGAETTYSWRIGPKPIIPEPCRCERPDLLSPMGRRLSGWQPRSRA